MGLSTSHALRAHASPCADGTLPKFAGKPRGQPEEADGRRPTSLRGRRFALVIPALNEEQAIGATIERALAARLEVAAATGIDEMLVVFVNDGSTDGTQAIVERHPEVIRIRFETNRGYGAAIKAGFQATDAELVGFMDADGTCDPRFCIQLIQELDRSGADVVLGARLSADSEMPAIRRLGNRIFARLVGIVSGQSLTDSASGMRVIRRSSLRRMVPLPDGLHFTPAMSCIVLLDPRLRIAEVPMPYKERIGKSKLRVLRDGVKFLAIILFAASCFNPMKTLLALGLLFGLLGAGMCAVAAALGASGLTLGVLAAAFVLVFLQAAFAGLVCHQLTFLLIGPRRVPGRAAQLVDRLFWTRPMVIAGIGSFLAGGLLWGVAGNLSPPWNGGAWTAAAGAILLGGWSALGGVMLRVVWATRERLRADWEDPFAVGRPKSSGGPAAAVAPAHDNAILYAEGI